LSLSFIRLSNVFSKRKWNKNALIFIKMTSWREPSECWKKTFFRSKVKKVVAKFYVNTARVNFSNHFKQCKHEKDTAFYNVKHNFFLELKRCSFLVLSKWKTRATWGVSLTPFLSSISFNKNKIFEIDNKNQIFMEKMKLSCFTLQ
jgi:hypothetical protein